ncbi:MAG: histidine triad nucleotide-binding protein [Gammaproteobacteria bacterium]
MSDCLFCKIASGAIQPRIAYEDTEVLAFHDLNPQAPVHILVIPKTHIATLNDLEAGHVAVVGKLYLAASRIAKEQGFDQCGYRTVMNCNADAGQSVFHIHLHLLAGRAMGWPPFP